VIATLALAMALQLSAQSAEPAAQASGSPTIRRFALLIGANEGGTGRTALRYAHSDAQAMDTVLRELGGVSSEDRMLLLDPSRDDIVAAFGQLALRVEAADNAQREVVFYYSGHSDGSGLLMPDGAHFSYAQLRKALDQVPAEVRIAILDSCASGELTRLKGGTTRPSFLVDTSSLAHGHAFLTSSSAEEAAQESDQIGSSFFTHYLVSGLRGAADTTGDGRITLLEAYQFAFRETLARTESTQAGAQHPAYAIDLVGTGDLVMTDLHGTSAGLYLDAALSGHVFVREAHGQLVAEVRKSPGHPMELALDPGSYEITLERGGRYYQAGLSIAAGAPVVFDERSLVMREVEPTRVRGEVSDLMPERRSVAVNVSLVPPLSINDAVAGALHVDVVNQVQFNLLAGSAAALRGAGFSGIVNILRDESSGASFSGIANLVGGKSSGAQFAGILNTAGKGSSDLQAAGIVNVSEGAMRGAQLAGIVNVTSGALQGFEGAGIFNWSGQGGRGLQLAGISNYADRALDGMQLAGAVDVAEQMDGLQLAGAVNTAAWLRGAQIAAVNVGGVVRGLQLGVINVASDSTGAQVGLINVSKHTEGAPVGLLNFMGNGRVSLDAWTGDSNAISLGLKLGTRTVYGLLTAGINPLSGDVPWFIGGGIGKRFDVHPVFLDLELVTGVVGLNHQSPDNNILSKVRFYVGWPLADRLSVFAGLSANVWVVWNGNEAPNLSLFLGHTFHSGQTTTQIWPAPFVGVEF
jgi:uncharacterized caspase-like protein